MPAPRVPPPGRAQRRSTMGGRRPPRAPGGSGGTTVGNGVAAADRPAGSGIGEPGARLPSGAWALALAWPGTGTGAGAQAISASITSASMPAAGAATMITCRPTATAWPRRPKPATAGVPGTRSRPICGATGKSSIPGRHGSISKPRCGTAGRRSRADRRPGSADRLGTWPAGYGRRRDGGADGYGRGDGARCVACEAECVEWACERWACARRLTLPSAGRRSDRRSGAVAQAPEAHAGAGHRFLRIADEGGQVLLGPHQAGRPLPSLPANRRSRRWRRRDG